MEFLKSIIVAIILCMTTLVHAQTQQQLRDAFSKSYSLEAEKNYTGAISALVAVYDASSYETNLRLGWLCYTNAQYDKSVSYYKIAIKLMPAATEPLWAILNPFTAKEDWINAESTYQSILKLDTKNSSANYHLGLIYYYRKNYTAAKKYLDVSLNLNPFDYYSMLMSAWANYFLGKPSDAKVLFNKVLLYSPNDVSALEGLSLIK